MKALYQRCIGPQRKAARLTFTNLVYNMLRFEQIKRLNLNTAACGVLRAGLIVNR